MTKTMILAIGFAIGVATTALTQIGPITQWNNDPNFRVQLVAMQAMSLGFKAGSVFGSYKVADGLGDDGYWFATKMCDSFDPTVDSKLSLEDEMNVDKLYFLFYESFFKRINVPFCLP